MLRHHQVPQRGVVGGHIAVKGLLLAVGEGKAAGVDAAADGDGCGDTGGAVQRDGFRDGGLPEGFAAVCAALFGGSMERRV